ncbi:hypothetical protein BU26DRAFT_520656 [Trematosphaeria pertusa]|uniref:Uncharacterized protein n=1 Tax=Trematosphaeria pertusa TaxID=390896 RepID=A0A6A6IBE3_9PLEO|nr:uncharacterized protein BU26DRAFT_520656 [Trematosphaeria pertusa]KAF2247527.1 hypothetical protein BU26DRAFT_520656 [Trematosphaeria pertusa]
MASIEEKIRNAASRNAELLEGIHETDSAPSQLYQQIQYIQDLESQVKKTEKHAADLQKKTASELKDHKKYSESTFRRFAHKASGRKDRFDEKAAKEEREYFNAIQAQKTAEDGLGYVRQLRAEAETTKDKYEAQARRHDELQHELDALYNSIFAGHTPGFPEEDTKENACNEAHRHVQDVNRALERERHVVFLLRQTIGKLNEARRHLDNAHQMSQMDLFGGGTMWSMQKRNHLEHAESAISQVKMLQGQIRQIAPQLADLGPMNIASGSIWTDVVFDNIFTDMEMHDKIKASEAQIDRAGDKCAQQVRQAEEREKRAMDDLREANEQLRRARLELQKAREEAFRRVAGGERILSGGGAQQVPDDAPPAYSA